jgi:hypothetical protein
MCKITAQVTQRLVWFDVGPDVAPKELKFGALTVKTSSPFYNDHSSKPTSMLTAYSYFVGEYEDFLKAACEFTGLDILEYDTHYTLQFLVDMGDGKLTEQTVIRNLTAFVELHFKPYDPKADDKAHKKELKKRGIT